jgi:hypothetical protein
MRVVRDQQIVGTIEPRRCPARMFSRRHIDLQRVAGALCPGSGESFVHSR